MESRTRVWLNSIGLQDIDPTIHIRDVAYAAPKISTGILSNAKYNGGRVTRQRLDSTEVTVNFEVHEYNTAMRQHIVQRIVAWAMPGGVLTCGDRPGQRLRVICTQPPAVTSALKWTSELSITFSAVSLPFWEDTDPTVLSLNGTSATGQLFGAGSAADPFVECTVKPVSGAITALTVTAGDTQIALSGLTVASGKAVLIGYDDDHIQYIRDENGNGLLSRRTATSDDDLMIPAGKFSQVGYTANLSCIAEFRVRGLYL